ncbi:hypothetical protein [Sphingobium sp. YR768]|uniref:hypothetical protein n=1 Tax=Sphingobium sp. YR768 TaxID=1884365 RepID=UPI0008B80CB9|nr:hypothetical protein [Sphingobium sp. YR768]SES19771.1 hypothetical protein SAMN05518866_1608 [Sphingobium sp. YR768]
MNMETWTLLGQFGPLGLMIGYLVWRETRITDARQQVERERTESDKALAAALSALTVTIQHLEQRIGK